MSETREQDEIIAEVRAIREALAAKHGYDVDRLFEEAERRQQASKRELMEPSPKQLQMLSNP